MRYVMGGINYFALMETYFKFWDDKSTPMFFQPMYYTAMHNKQPMFKIAFKNPIFASLSENTNDVTQLNTQEKTFTMTWVYNSIQFKLPSDINNE
jgi:hypothetical protein